MSGEGILALINETPISPDEMDAYLMAMEEYDGDPSFEAAVFVASNVFDKDTNKCMSVNMRLTALSKLIESEVLPGWVKPKEPDGSYKVAANVYAAAGLEPMIKIGDDWGFDVDSLLKRAFQLGKINA